MASEAQRKQKILDDELAKPSPDPDVVYYLKTTSPYWNTVDTESMRRGASKVSGNEGLFALLRGLEKSHED